MKRMAKFGPRYGMKRFDEGGETKAPKKPLPPDAPGDPSMDLPPRGNLPDKPVIPPGKGFGDDVKKKPPVKKAKGGSLPDLTGDGKITRADVLKGRGVFKKGGSVGSASKRADGCAVRGKTRGKMV